MKPNDRVLSITQIKPQKNALLFKNENYEGMKNLKRIKSFNQSRLGQVFTKESVVDQMISLIRNKGRILEPSCGKGAFSSKLDCVSIELDARIAPPKSLVIDFFDFPEDQMFDTVIGNPPYVRYQDILPETRDKIDSHLFDKRANLNLFFIEKSIKHLKPHGELIFIVPRDFMKSTSAIKLNNWIYEMGTITDWIEFGDSRIFRDVSFNPVIFRFEKSNLTRKCNEDEIFEVSNGQIFFHKERSSCRKNFSELFFVKVGAVSGADKYFASEKGNISFVNSKTNKTGELKKMFYNIPAPELEPFKSLLMSRKTRKFDENNWFLWGRNFYESNKPRIYVNCKTRNAKPFFISNSFAYDGSVLAIFPREEVDESKLNWYCERLNSIDWEQLGFKVGGRFIFSQRSLSNCIIPW